MLLQTNSYIVPKEKKADHARLLGRFRQVMARLGCDQFEVYEQTGPSWSGEPTGRFVQLMRFRDHRHQRAVQDAERADAAAQALIAEFCELVNIPYQQQQGLFAVGFYQSVIAVTHPREVQPAGMFPQAPQAAQEQPDDASVSAPEVPAEGEAQGELDLEAVVDVEQSPDQPDKEQQG